MDGSPVLPDVLSPGLRVIFCGSAAGARSAQRQAYYAGPGNRFWPLLCQLGLTPRLLRPEEYQEVLASRIGLTDLAKAVFGPDRRLPEDCYDPESLRRRIEACRPGCLAFNGKRPAQAFLGRMADYGLQPEAIGATRIVVLPSTSRANAGFQEGPWRDLARLVRDL